MQDIPSGANGLDRDDIHATSPLGVQYPGWMTCAGRITCSGRKKNIEERTLQRVRSGLKAVLGQDGRKITHQSDKVQLLLLPQAQHFGIIRTFTKVADMRGEPGRV